MPMLLTTLFSGAWGLIQRLFRLVLAYPLQAALIIALLACSFFYGAWQEAVDTIAKRDATIVQMEQASKDARAAQLAMNKANTDRQTDIARNADNDQTTRRDIADRSSRYADGMRADAYCRKASATAEDRLAESDNSAGSDAIVVSADDFRILTDNTARLVEVKAWGDDLIQADLAVPVE